MAKISLHLNYTISINPIKYFRQRTTCSENCSPLKRFTDGKGIFFDKRRLLSHRSLRSIQTSPFIQNRNDKYREFTESCRQ